MGELNDELNRLIKDKINSQAFPVPCKITKIYEDKYVDVKIEDFGELKYVKSIIEHEIDDITVLLFLNNNFESRMVI